MTNKEHADLFCKEWLQGKSSFTFRTSGSTGAPKIIELHRDQMIASATKTIKALDLREGMTSLVCLDVNFIAGSMMLVRSMVANMNMIVVEPKSNPFDGISSEIDFAAMVPYQVENTADGSFHGKIIVGGASISPELLEKIKRIRHATFYATFGMTETVSHIALQQLNGDNPQDHFHTLQGIEISTDDRQCLIIKADHLNDVVVTNDIVDIISPNEFKWIGRYDNVINSGGVKITPEKVEEIIEGWFKENGFDNRFFVTGIDHEKLGAQVVLVVERKLPEIEEGKLLASLRDRLNKYEVPKQVLYAEKFITGPTQKINRKQSIENALPRPSSLR